MAIDGSGRVVVVWVESPEWQYDLYGAAWAPGGPWELLNRINWDSGQEMKFDPAVAVHYTGQVAVAWEDFSCGNRAVFYALSSFQLYLPLILK